MSALVQHASATGFLVAAGDMARMAGGTVYVYCDPRAQSQACYRLTLDAHAVVEAINAGWVAVCRVDVDGTVTAVDAGEAHYQRTKAAHLADA